MVGEGWGGEQRRQGGGRGERDGQDDGQASAHNDGMVLHHCPSAHAQGNDSYRELRCFIKRFFPARLRRPTARSEPWVVVLGADDFLPLSPPLRAEIAENRSCLGLESLTGVASDNVRFTPESRHFPRSPFMSAFDPKRTSRYHTAWKGTGQSKAFNQSLTLGRGRHRYAGIRPSDVLGPVRCCRRRGNGTRQLGLGAEAQNPSARSARSSRERAEANCRR